MEQSIQDKIAKIYELVKRGGTDGEKAAAQVALDKLLKKYDLSEEFLATIHIKDYHFKYATSLDLALWKQLFKFFLPHLPFNASKSTLGRKEIIAEFEYTDWVIMETTYEYFRRHAAQQFKEFCLPKIKKCRTTKTKNKRRAELQDLFFSQYVLKSEIYLPHQKTQVDTSKMSKKEYDDRMNLENIEGGKFHNQVNTGLYLE